MINANFTPGGLYRIINASDKYYDCIAVYQDTIFDELDASVEAPPPLRFDTQAGMLEIGELVIYIKGVKHLRFAHVASSLGLVIIPTFCLKREK